MISVKKMSELTYEIKTKSKLWRLRGSINNVL